MKNILSNQFSMDELMVWFFKRSEIEWPFRLIEDTDFFLIMVMAPSMFHGSVEG